MADGDNVIPVDFSQQAWSDPGVPLEGEEYAVLTAHTEFGDVINFVAAMAESETEAEYQSCVNRLKFMVSKL